MSPGPARADELPHPPGPDPGWHEVFELGFADAEASLGGSVVVTVHPHHGVTWFWAAIVRRHLPLVTVYEDGAPLPRGTSLELRTSGLWVDVEVEVPFEHVTLGMEAFGLAFDDPDEALGAARGTRVPAGFDLEWESDAAAARRDGSGYDLPCRVHGDVLVGPERLELDGWGWRMHRWGSGDLASSYVRADVRAVDGRVWTPAPQPGEALAGVRVVETVGRAPVRVPVLGASAPGPVLDRTLTRVADRSGAPGTMWSTQVR